jgi:hypothetical protein
MRILVPATIIMLTAAWAATGWATVPTQASVPPTCQVSGCLADDVAAQGEGACECERQPGVLGSVFGRFLNPTECDPHWCFTADAVALQRLSTRGQSLFRNANDTADLLNARELNFPTNVGFQLSAVRRGRCGWEVELGYFQIDNWQADSNVAGESLMVTGGDGSGFLVTDGEAHYKSAIHLAEINVRRQWCEGLTLLAGFRAGEVNEFYDEAGLGARSPVPISLNVNTFNHLYGFQLGANYEFYNMGGPLRISSLCKAGIYDNSAIQSSRQIETGTSDETLGAHRNQAAFMGEVGAMATYQVTCHLSFRAFCQAVWIEGLALAPEQIGATNFSNGDVTIDTHGGIFYYGGGLGAELKF